MASISPRSTASSSMDMACLRSGRSAGQGYADTGAARSIRSRMAR
jgi:hypothetical protein